ncbi:MAG: hypothetical protein ACRDJ4_02445 [Actinomycetota bacterium]
MRLLPALPLILLASSTVLLLFGRRIRHVAGVLATAAMAASFVVSLRLFADLIARPPADRRVVQTVFEWISAGPVRAGFDLGLDPLSAVMILVVTGVGTLIHWYSTGYMAHEERRATTSDGSTCSLSRCCCSCSRATSCCSTPAGSWWGYAPSC